MWPSTPHPLPLHPPCPHAYTPTTPKSSKWMRHSPVDAVNILNLSAFRGVLIFYKAGVDLWGGGEGAHVCDCVYACVCVWRFLIWAQVPGTGSVCFSAQSQAFNYSLGNMTHRFNFSIENEHSYDKLPLPVCFAITHLLQLPPALPTRPPFSLLCSIIDKKTTVIRLPLWPELLYLCKAQHLPGRFSLPHTVK